MPVSSHNGSCGDLHPMVSRDKPLANIVQPFCSSSPAQCLPCRANVARDPGPYRALNWSPVVWLGRISYSLYLWQELFCSNASLHLKYFSVVPALACACLSYYCVEQPILRLRDKNSDTLSSGPQELRLHGSG